MTETNTEEYILYDYIYSKHTKYKLSYRAKSRSVLALPITKAIRRDGLPRGTVNLLEIMKTFCLNCHGCFMDTDTGTSQVVLVVKNPPANAGDAKYALSVYRKGEGNDVSEMHGIHSLDPEAAV